MNFLDYAQKAQKDLADEQARLKSREDALDARASLVAGQVATADEREKTLNDLDREIAARNEVVTTKELKVRRDTDVQHDLELSVALNKKVEGERKKAQEYYDDARMKLEDLEKRELALSAREKTYKQDLELEVMRNFTFRK